MSELRDELAAVICEHVDDCGPAEEALRAADALLARYAILPLPTNHTDRVWPIGTHFREWDTGSNGTIRGYRNGTILGGHSYWNTTQGDDPELFAAALVASARYTRGEGQ